MKRKMTATKSAGHLHLNLLTIKDAAQILGVSRNTLNGMLANGMLSYVKVSRHTRRIPEQVLADFVTRTKKEEAHD